MEKEEIYQKVRHFMLQHFPPDDQEVTSTMRLSDTLLVDSFAVMEVVMFIEQEFDIALQRRDLDEIKTLETIAQLIIRKL